MSAALSTEPDVVERLLRIYARRVSAGESSFSDAVDRLVTAERRERFRSGAMSINPIHHTLALAPGYAEPRYEDAMGDALVERIDTLENGGAAALWPALLRPAYPDVGVPLAEGQRQAQAAIVDFTASLRLGVARELLLLLTVGGGKSEAAIRGLGAMLDAAHTAGREGALYYLIPHHKLSAEVRNRITAANPGRAVAVWYGMAQADPEAPGSTMCLATELPDRALAAGLKATVACGACPLRDACGYRRQARQDPEIWIVAHAIGFRPKPAALPQAAVTVWDEDFTAAGIAGAQPDKAPQLAAADLAEMRTGPVTGANRDRLIALRAQAFGLCMSVKEGRSLRHRVEAAGFTVAALEEWASLEWATAPQLDLAGLDRKGIADALADAAASGFNRGRARLAKFWASLLQGPHATSVNIEHVAEADLGRGRSPGPAVRFAWRQDFAKWCAEAPKLFLGATTRPEILRHWSPGLEVRAIEIAAPQQRVTQVVREFGRTFFTKQPRNVGALADLVLARLASTTGPVLVVLQAAVETRLAAVLQERLGDALPPRLRLAHHGNLVGLNQYEDAEVVIVVGRPAVNRAAAERLACLIAGESIDCGEEPGNAWSLVPAGIRMADGTAIPARQPHHAHQLVEAVRWSISEGAVLQAIGRGRGVRRAVEVLYLGGFALPLPVTAATTWRDIKPSRIEAAAAEAALAGRVLPLAAADLSASHFSRWKTAKAAECDLARRKNQNPQIPYIQEGLCISGLRVLARYRKAGSRRWSYCIAPALADLAAVQADLGFSLASFDAGPAATPAEPQQSPQEVPMPLPCPASPSLRLARLALRLEAVRPEPSIAASLYTPPRRAWWQDPPMRAAYLALRQWEAEEAETPAQPGAYWFWRVPHAAVLEAVPGCWDAALAAHKLHSPSPPSLAL